MKQANFLKPTEIADLGERLFRHPGPYPIKDEDLEKIFPGIGHVRVEPLLIDTHIKGDLDPPDLRFLTRLVKHLEPMRILEVGTYRGRTTYNMAHSSPDALVITIDLPREKRAGDLEYYGTDVKYFQEGKDIGIFFRGKPEESRITQVLADSLSEECKHYVDELLKGNKLDIAFIDSSHDYISVKRNFENLILPRMSEDGVVVFDDYVRPFTHVGISHYLTRKAHDDGFVFYWYAPGNEETHCVIFLNIPETRNYRWRET